MTCCCGIGIAHDDPRFVALDAYMAQVKDEPGALIAVLHRAQSLFGYLPEIVQAKVAEALSIPLVDVYGVVTFYNFFTTDPVGKYSISVCLGTACYVKGAGRILDKLREELSVEPGQVTDDGLFSLEVCRCVGACSLAPAVVVAGEVRHMSEHDVPAVLAELRQRNAVEEETKVPVLVGRR